MKFHRYLLTRFIRRSSVFADTESTRVRLGACFECAQIIHCDAWCVREIFLSFLSLSFSLVRDDEEGGDHSSTSRMVVTWMDGHVWLILAIVIGAGHPHSLPFANVLPRRSTWVLTGQVLNYNVGSASIAPASRLILQLQDLSAGYANPLSIAEQTYSVTTFPIAFNMSYSPEEVLLGHSYGISARIVDDHNVLCFANNRLVEVKLLGGGRTTFIDIPVIFVELDDDYSRLYKVPEWPELLGIDGKTAVRLIKQQTGRSMPH